MWNDPKLIYIYITINIDNVNEGVTVSDYKLLCLLNRLSLTVHMKGEHPKTSFLKNGHPLDVWLKTGLYNYKDILL